jgi:membrane protein implicated in regulation of membrane protease activity
VKQLDPASSRALTWLAALLWLTGLLLGSPGGAFFAFLVAAVLAAVPTLFGSGKMRVVAAVILLIAAGFAAGHYAGFKSEQERYRQPAQARP